MIKQKPFTSCIIGDDKVVIQSAEILLSRKHAILTIISANPVIQEWAQKENISCVPSIAVLKRKKKIRCDYLFSIINHTILPEWVLKLPKYFAI